MLRNNCGRMTLVLFRTRRRDELEAQERVGRRIRKSRRDPGSFRSDQFHVDRLNGAAEWFYIRNSREQIQLSCRFTRTKLSLCVLTTTATDCSQIHLMTERA